MTEFQNKIDKEEQKSEATHEQKEMLGAVLREAREAKKYTTAEVATRLHLRNVVVEEIERDDFSNISSATYVRGYVRNYARLVEADLATIEACLAHQVPTVASPAMHSFSRKTSIEKRDTHWMWLTYFIVIVSIALAVWWWVQKPASVDESLSKPTIEELQAPNDNETPVMEPTNRGTISGRNTTEDSGQVAEAASEVTTPDSAYQQPLMPEANSATEDSASAANTATTDATPETRVAAAEDSVSTSETAAISKANIELILSGDCWIKASDASGHVMIDGLKTAGQHIQVAGIPPISVILGAPQVVTLKYNDANVSLDGYKAGRVARLTLPQA
ncbi:RodZ domain-containing protein [Shewanella sp.]|uniref:RodZ domain-containing protein n=1 Tax=Shewanella sp. TaxID=50422 RepID=UPI003A973D43